MLKQKFYFFKKLNARGQVHTEIDESPLDALAFVLFLLENEHVVVEELLEFLVGEVDTKLLEGVELYNFKLVVNLSIS